jgi:OOP family OmpA-OmpF porin
MESADSGIAFQLPFPERKILMQKALFQPRLRRSYRVAAGVLLALASTTWAQAQSDRQTNQSMTPANQSFMAPGSSYIGLSAGTSDLRRPITGLENFGGSGQASYGLSVGSYFNQNFGVELGYHDFGSVNRAGGSTKVDGINLSLIGRAPVASSFNLLGKLGTTYSRTDVSATAPGVATGSERGFDWSYGIGAEWLFHPQWSGVLGYDEHYVKYPGANERISDTSLTLRYRY